MDFSQTPQEQLFLQMITAFAEKEVKPLAAEIDAQERFPIETVKKMAKLGIMGIPIQSNELYGCRGTKPRMCYHWGSRIGSHLFVLCSYS